MLELVSYTPEFLDIVRVLFKEYEKNIGIDLCFQNFNEELRQLPGDYAEPRGALLIARFDGKIAGCCALRPVIKEGFQNAAELKRLFIRPAFRGHGIARTIVIEILRRASEKGYQTVILDTLKTMTEAQALYGKLGFEEIPAYYANPEPGVRYMKLDLRTARLT